MARTSRKTQQKQFLAELIDKQKGFFTTQDILDKLANTEQTIGSATVYRYLSSQKTMGKLHAYTCEGKTLYSKSKTNHCHFICESCGNMEHISVEKLDFLPKNAGEICHVQIDVTGTCRMCLGKK